MAGTAAEPNQFCLCGVELQLARSTPVTNIDDTVTKALTSDVNVSNLDYYYYYYYYYAVDDATYVSQK